MEENKKNNAVEKVENTVKQNNGNHRSTRLEIERLREQRKLEKQKLSAQKEREKARLREQRLIERNQRQALAREERARKRKERKKSANGGLVTAVISLGIATLILSSILTFTFLTPTKNDNLLEYSYQKSYYDTVERVKNMDLNLSKVIASKDQVAMQGYLMDLAINSELAENNIQQLPLQDESKYYTSKLINQIGDYAKYLNKKIARGESLTEQEKTTLFRLSVANATLLDTLNQTTSGMDENFSFTALSEQKDSAFLQSLTELENLSVEYPELIYDGPFSDGVDNKEIKGLTGENITEAGAKEEFTKIFSNLGLTDIQNAGELNGKIECFNLSATVNGDLLYAQISKIGGKLIMFDYAGSCNATSFDESSAKAKAEEFLAGLGLQDMKAVWSDISNNAYTFNFAYTQNNVVVYADLIKVRVCAETNMVIGMEATGYYINHTERIIGNPVITEKKARSYVSDDMEVQKGRLVLVPVGEMEKLCYEFEGWLDDSVYYIYIDAVTGKQVELLKVITSTEGNLLM